MLLEGSKSYNCDYAKVAVMMLGIADFQRCEEELDKLLTTNANNQRLSNEGDWDYEFTSGLEFGTC